jgi:hypothetical protein
VLWQPAETSLKQATLAVRPRRVPGGLPLEATDAVECARVEAQLAQGCRRFEPPGAHRPILDHRGTTRGASCADSPTGKRLNCGSNRFPNSWNGESRLAAWHPRCDVAMNARQKITSRRGVSQCESDAASEVGVERLTGIQSADNGRMVVPSAIRSPDCSSRDNGPTGVNFVAVHLRYRLRCLIGELGAAAVSAGVASGLRS